MPATLTENRVRHLAPALPLLQPTILSLYSPSEIESSQFQSRFYHIIHRSKFQRRFALTTF